MQLRVRARRHRRRRSLLYCAPRDIGIIRISIGRLDTGTAKRQQSGKLNLDAERLQENATEMRKRGEAIMTRLMNTAYIIR